MKKLIVSAMFAVVAVVFSCGIFASSSAAAFDGKNPSISSKAWQREVAEHYVLVVSRKYYKQLNEFKNLYDVEDTGFVPKSIRWEVGKKFKTAEGYEVLPMKVYFTVSGKVNGEWKAVSNVEIGLHIYKNEFGNNRAYAKYPEFLYANRE